MTRTEAITILKNAAWLGTNEDREKIEQAVSEIEKWMTMSKTFENYMGKDINVPSNDLISRQRAIDALLGITAMRNTIPLDSAIFNIQKLPSAQPDGRYINADELIKRLKEAGHEEAAAMALKMAGHERKKNLPSAQRWVPCSERLPEKEGWYITTVESEKTGKRRIENDLFAIDIALAHGLTPNRFCKDGHRQRTVAWCEFPEPWRGEEHDEVGD